MTDQQQIVRQGNFDHGKIIETIELLDQEGVPLTLERVRTALGGGSYSTITPILRKWKADKEVSRTQAIDMPAELRLAMERFGGQLWQKANTAAAEKIRAAETRLHDKEADYLAEAEAYSTENKRLEDQLTALQKQNQTLQEELKNHQDEYLGMATRQARMEERVENLEHTKKRLTEQLDIARKESNDLKNEVDVLEKQHAEATGQVSALKESQTKAEAEARTSHRKGEKLIGELAAIKEQKRQQEETAEQFERDNLMLKESLNQQAVQWKTTEALNKKLSKELANSRESISNLQSQLAVCTTKLKQHDMLPNG